MEQTTTGSQIGLEILKIVLPFFLAIVVHYLTLRYEEKKYQRSVLRERVEKAYSKFYISFSFGLVTIMANENEIMSDYEFLKNFSQLSKFLVENISYFEKASQERIAAFHTNYTIVEAAIKANHDVEKELKTLRKNAIAICNGILIEYRHLCSKLKMPEPAIRNI
ncbi:hypothetical protein MWG07_09325 [Fusobacterium necrophorum]|uniref:Uncharacterized protein n=1 Tax=Fusobacterium necrophorum TaxID=859 RepID=A0AAW6WCT7_9FUSO|nr:MULTISPECIES: hypothetical protein [Fusobacterium]AYV93804.1 hypothetical protein BSQ88_09030 [Fusobacterium necrophorum subsp. funduliforme]KYM45002.1 hypothetical protein A2U05_09555 [Fusobacterium necrophorum subsp. funduliforme]MDK4481221.1 hypothetical protein [Fusobacterium necrophorum]MDK4512447.1 hypothetical protein [Fusobacterium necrophorum]RXZ26894.1 hypothetical protein EPT55_07680 [Fusobacterium necrophorum]